MNSIHDFGGMQGYGPVIPDVDEPIFAHDWERLGFGVNMLMIVIGLYKADESRHAMEKIPPVHYLDSPYYLHWIEGFERILLEKGIVTEEELKTGVSEGPAPDWLKTAELPPNDQMGALVRAIHDMTGDASDAQRFAVGDKVRAININPRTHTRLPRYIRGHVGTVTAAREAFVYADQRAHSDGEDPQWVYSVRFEGAELWGPDAGVKDAVYIDLYQPYIEPA